MGALVSIVIQFSNNAFERVVRYSALLAFVQEASKPFKFTLRFLKQAQSGTHHLACGTISAILKLYSYKIVKVGPSVMLVFLAMSASCTKYWYMLPKSP
jgi:hypothetical protein